MDDSQRRSLELGLAAAIVSSALIVALATVALIIGGPEWLRASVILSCVGMVGVALAIAASYPLDAFKLVFRGTSAASQLDPAQRVSRLKASGLLLNLLAFLGVAVLLLGFADRIHLIELNVSVTTIHRLAGVLVIALVANIAHAHLLALRVGSDRSSNLPLDVYHYLGISVTSLFAILALMASERTLHVGAIHFTSADTTMFLLGAASVAGGTLFASRSLPNLFNIFKEDPLKFGGRDYVSKTKAILLPAVTAFALLFVVLLFLFIFGIGTVGLRSPAYSLVLVLVLVAIGVSIVASARLAKSEDVAELYRMPLSVETRTGRIILSVSLTIAALFGVFAMYLLRGGTPFGLNPFRWIDFLSVGAMIGLGPYGFYVHRRHRRIRQIEERFPDFLRDVAASHRGGLTLSASVQLAARGDYGLLSPDVQRMADQLSWNVPFNEALERLMDRVKTPLVQRAISLIIEASRSGGATTDTLLAAARDAREIKNLENERRSTMSLYSIIIYIVFFVFLLVAGVLYGQFVPEIVRGAASAAQTGTQSLGSISLDVPTQGEFRAFYFTAALSQAVGNGMMGGLFQTGKALSGLRHAFVMVLITYITFVFVFP